MHYTEFVKRGRKEGYSKEFFKELLYDILDHNAVSLLFSRLFIRNHIDEWKNFNVEEAEEMVKNWPVYNERMREVKEEIIKFLKWKYHPIDYALDVSSKIKDSSKKLSTKKFKLKEDTLPVVVSMRLRKATAQRIFVYGIKHGYSDDLLKLLSLKDKMGIYMVNAGDGNWKNFDYEKGYKEIIKKRHPNSLVLIGTYWNWNGFPRKQAIELIKQWSPNKPAEDYYMRIIEKDWPLDIEGAEEKSREIRDKSIKLPTKKLKLEGVLKPMKPNRRKNPLIHIFYRFNEGEISLDKAIKETEELEKKYGYYNKIYDGAFLVGDNIPALIYELGYFSAKRLDKDPKYIEKLLPLLIKYDKYGNYTKKAANFWGGKAGDIMLAYSDKIKTGSKKLPAKKFKLD